VKIVRFGASLLQEASPVRGALLTNNIFMILLKLMKTPDFDKERSEKSLSLLDFLESYNENLPSGFPNASLPFLKEFKKTYPKLFKDDNLWTLVQHRKKFMDWPPQRKKCLPQ